MDRYRTVVKAFVSFALDSESTVAELVTRKVAGSNSAHRDFSRTLSYKFSIY